MYITSNTVLYISKCQILSNVALQHGGGIYTYLVSVANVVSSVIYLNLAYGGGGGVVLNYPTSNMTFYNSSLVANMAFKSSGGALYVLKGTLYLIDSRLDTNQASGSSFYVTTGNCKAIGSCIYSTNYPNTYSSGGCTFTVNEGGSISATTFDLSYLNEEDYDKFIVYQDGIASVSFSGTVGPTALTLNSSGSITWEGYRTEGSNIGFEVCFDARSHGGGIYVASSGVVSLRNTELHENVATDLGGGFYINGGHVSLNDGSSVKDSSAGEGSALYFAGGSFAAVGVSLSGSIAGDSAQCASCISPCLSGYFGNCSTMLSTAPSCFFDCECIKCPAGKYNLNQGSVSVLSCSDCLSGFAASEGLSACEGCPVGKFASADANDSGGGVEQQTTSGATTCNDCPVGRFAQSKYSIVCQACGAGTYSYSGSSVCVKCSLGEYSLTEAAQCSKCSPGTFSNTTGTSTCSSCSVGMYASNAGSITCASCEEGTYQGTFGQSVCISCLAGWFSDTPGSSSCSSCSVGMHASNAGSATCASCQVGTYQGTSGQSVCINCLAGKYSSTIGAGSCDSCATGKDSAKGSNTCDLAASDFFWNPRTRLFESCPAHSDCLGGDFIPIPKAGYWANWDNVQDAGLIFACFRETCTQSSIDDNMNTLVCWRKNTTNSTACKSNTLQCAVGAIGPLCGSCDVGFYYSSSDHLCRSCDTRIMKKIVIILVGLSIAIVVSSLYSGLIPIPKDKRTLWILGILRHIDSGTIRVVWSNYQIVSSIALSLGIPFPKPFPGMLSLLSFVSLNFLPLSCLPSSSYFNETYFWSALPLLFAVITVLYFAASAFILSGREHIDRSHQRHCLFNRCVTYLLMLTYLVLPPVSSKQYQGLNCLRIRGESPQSYLRVDTSINCYSDAYLRFQRIDIACIAIYSVIPPMWLYLLWKQRKRLNPPTSDLRLANHLRETDVKVAHLCFLFNAYHPRYYYFEAIEISSDRYRRILFIGVLPLLSQDASRRAALGFVLSLMSLILYREVEPFRRGMTNLLAYIAQLMLLITFGSALAIGTNLARNLNKLIFGIALVLTNLVVLAFALFIAWRRSEIEERRNRIRLESQAQQIEWAVSFLPGKWATTLEAICRNSIPPSHCLVFWYTSLEGARNALRSGIPALQSGGLAGTEAGVVFTLHYPNDFDSDDMFVFPKRLQEAVLACSVRRCLLKRIPGELKDSSLRILPGSVMQALRGKNFDALIDPKPWFEGSIFLPPQQIVRAYQLVAHSENIHVIEEGGGVNSPPALTDGIPLHERVQICTPTNFLEYCAEMSACHSICAANGWVALYHYTQPALGERILDSGLRMSTQGQSDGGVYFSLLGPASLKVGSRYYEKNVIADCFGPGRIDEFLGKHKLDLCLVYGAEPLSLSECGRSNARFISKDTFEALALPDSNGSFYLRADRILAAFLLDPSKPAAGFWEAKVALDEERERDKATKDALFLVQRCMDENEHDINEFVAQRRESLFLEDESLKLDFDTLVDNESTSLQGDATDVGMIELIDGHSAGGSSTDSGSNMHLKSRLNPLLNLQRYSDFSASKSDKDGQDTIVKGKSVDGPARNELPGSAEESELKALARSTELVESASVENRPDQIDEEILADSALHANHFIPPSSISSNPRSPFQSFYSVPLSPRNVVQTPLHAPSLSDCDATI